MPISFKVSKKVLSSGRSLNDESNSTPQQQLPVFDVHGPPVIGEDGARRSVVLSVGKSGFEEASLPGADASSLGVKGNEDFTHWDTPERKVAEYYGVYNSVDDADPHTVISKDQLEDFMKQGCVSGQVVLPLLQKQPSQEQGESSSAHLEKDDAVPGSTDPNVRKRKPVPILSRNKDWYESRKKAKNASEILKFDLDCAKRKERRGLGSSLLDVDGFRRSMMLKLGLNQKSLDDENIIVVKRRAYAYAGLGADTHFERLIADAKKATKGSKNSRQT